MKYMVNQLVRIREFKAPEGYDRAAFYANRSKPHLHFAQAMLEYIGKSYRIYGINSSDRNYKLDLLNDSESPRWVWSEEWLELAEKVTYEQFLQPR